LSGGTLNTGKRLRRALIAVTLVAGISLGPAGASAQTPAVTPQLAGLFQAIRDVIGPFAPQSKAVADALAALGSQFEALSSSGGDAAHAISGPAAEQLVDALIALNEALAENVPGMAESLTQLNDLAKQVAEAISGGADQVDGAITSNEEQLKALGMEMAPVLTQLCRARGPAALVMGFVAFGYMFDGLLIPLDTACTPPPESAPLPLDFGAMAADFGALTEQLFLTFEPYSDVLQPVAEPVCVAVAPAIVVAALGGGSLPVSFPLSGLVAPVSVVCSFGKGPDALQGLLVASSRTIEPFAPAVDLTTDAINELKPLTDLLAPVSDPFTSPLCTLGPLGDLGAALAVPIDTPIKPLTVLNNALLPFCGIPEIVSEIPEVVDDATDGLPPPVVGGDTVTSPSSFTVGVPGIGGAPAVGPVAIGQQGEDQTVVGVITRAGWLLVLATVLAALALASLLVPRRRAIALLLRITR
jgi:hypothetical protein